MCKSLFLSKDKQHFCTLVLGGACQISEKKGNMTTGKMCSQEAGKMQNWKQTFNRHVHKPRVNIPYKY